MGKQISVFQFLHPQCPDPECEASVPHETVRRLVDAALFERYDRVMRDRVIRAMSGTTW